MKKLIDKKVKIAAAATTAVLTTACLPLASEYINTNIVQVLPSFEVAAAKEDDLNPNNKCGSFQAAQKPEVQKYSEDSKVPTEPTEPTGNTPEPTDPKDSTEPTDPKGKTPESTPEPTTPTAETPPAPEPTTTPASEPEPTPEPNYNKRDHEKRDVDHTYETISEVGRKNRERYEKNHVEVEPEETPLAQPEVEKEPEENKEVTVEPEETPLAPPKIEKKEEVIIPEETPRSAPKKPVLPKTGQKENKGILGLAFLGAGLGIKKFNKRK